MVQEVLDLVKHPAGRTAIATIIGYGLILLGMTIVLIGGAWMLFRVFG